MKHFYFNFSSKCMDYTILHIPSSTTYKITEFLAGEVTLANIGFDAKCIPGQQLEKIKIFEVTQYIYVAPEVKSVSEFSDGFCMYLHTWNQMFSYLSQHFFPERVSMFKLEFDINQNLALFHSTNTDSIIYVFGEVTCTHFFFKIILNTSLYFLCV